MLLPQWCFMEPGTWAQHWESQEPDCFWCQPLLLVPGTSLARNSFKNAQSGTAAHPRHQNHSGTPSKDLQNMPEVDQVELNFSWRKLGQVLWVRDGRRRFWLAAQRLQETHSFKTVHLPFGSYQWLCFILLASHIWSVTVYLKYEISSVIPQ